RSVDLDVTQHNVHRVNQLPFRLDAPLPPSQLVLVNIAQREHAVAILSSAKHGGIGVSVCDTLAGDDATPTRIRCWDKSSLLEEYPLNQFQPAAALQTLTTCLLDAGDVMGHEWLAIRAGRADFVAAQEVRGYDRVLRPGFWDLLFGYR